MNDFNDPYLQDGPTIDPDGLDSPSGNPVPIPSNSSIERTPIAVVISDQKAIGALVEQIVYRSGMTQAELCRRLGISPSNFNQYRLGRRPRPSVWWLVRLLTITGGRMVVEFPSRPLK